jgi:hypothetical protein
VDLSAFVEPRARFERIPPPEPEEIDVIELRDNAARDAWAPDRDFELAVTLDAFTFAINHHVIDRNWDDAQATLTFTRDL